MVLAQSAMPLQSTPFFQLIEYLAVFSCGISGGLASVRKHYDISAIIITAWLTALGGGMIRDVFLGALPPAGVSDVFSVLTAFAAGALVAVVHPEVDRLHWSMIIIDAMALGLFAVNGTSKALLYDTSAMTAVFLGTFTAIGGGLIRDTLLNQVPTVIRDRHLYIVPAVVGSMLTVWVWRLEQHHTISYTVEMILDVIIVLLVIALRIISVRFDVQLPGPLTRHHAHLPRRILDRAARRDASQSTLTSDDSASSSHTVDVKTASDDDHAHA